VVEQEVDQGSGECRGGQGDVLERGAGPSGWWRWLVRWVLVPLALIPLVALVWFLALPWPLYLRWSDPGETSFMAYRREEARAAGEKLEIQRSAVPLEEISPRLRQAVLAAEDDRFYQHGGIDWRALAEEVRWQGDTTFSWWSGADRRALWDAVGYYREHRDEIKGRSTLTQQLAKNLFFTPERSLLRKLSEAVVAKRLEWLLSKARILELYLNVVELGPGIFGAEAASQTYFGHSARRLSLDEAAALAGTLPHPLSSNPAYRPARMQWRKGLILQRLGRGAPGPPPAVDMPTLPSDRPPPDTLPPDTLPPDTMRAGGEGRTGG
jgi:monofunctional biosynthetic peptidoglycan transglycosylase